MLDMSQQSGVSRCGRFSQGSRPTWGAANLRLFAPARPYLAGFPCKVSPQVWLSGAFRYNCIIHLDELMFTRTVVFEQHLRDILDTHRLQATHNINARRFAVRTRHFFETRRQ